MSKNDDKIKALMKTVEDKRSAIGFKPRSSWQTNGIFKFGDGSSHMNLNTVNSPALIVGALAHILRDGKSHEEAAEILGVSGATEILYDGYVLSDWIHDFKLRCEQITFEEEKAKLNRLEVQLKKMISEDTRTEMALDVIAAILK